jgi:hypothetical protein
VDVSGVYARYRGSVDRLPERRQNRPGLRDRAHGGKTINSTSRRKGTATLARALSAAALLLAGAGGLARTAPPSGLVLVSADYRDGDGDGDIFPDTGETGRLSLVVRNNGPSLDGVLATLSTTDPDVACILEGGVALGTFPAGTSITIGSLAPGTAGLSFRASDSLQSSSASDPARIDLCVTVSASDPPGFAQRLCFSLLADLDAIGGGGVFVPGPDGVAGTVDDGVILENFDTDRDGDGVLNLGDRPAGTPGALNDTIGVWVGNNPGGLNPIEVVGCGGFQVPPQDPECRIDPDYDMDWHLHCPPGSTDCAVSRPDHQTPTGGGLAFDGVASLHWGFHPLDATDVYGMSTTRFRQVTAFMTNPINLAFAPPRGSLELSFFHIVSLMDNNSIGFPPGQASDYGNVQVQVDLDPDPAVDQWGYWDRLVPFENAYDHVPYIWSAFGISPTYCNFTPIDGGPDGAAPRGYKELTCYPSGVWSHCGNVDSRYGYTFQCAGPGLAGTVGSGLWVQSRLNLDPYRGARVRIRWVAQSWEFDCCGYSYHELNSSWDSPDDDGWWLDQIVVNGALESQAAATVDDDAPPAGSDDVSDLAIRFSSDLGRGSGTVTWRTSSECDLTGFNVIVRDAHDRRVQLNSVLIPCEACVTGEGRSYAYPVPKHKSGRNLFLEVIHLSGVVRTVGPALRE